VTDDADTTPGGTEDRSVEIDLDAPAELERDTWGDGEQGGGADAEPLPPLRAALEAVLLVVDEPVAEIVLAQVLERPTEEVAARLRELAAEYDEQGRGFELRQVSGGWRLYTRPACAPYVERFVRDGQQARLTQAALETLAVVAYRQPVSRSRIAGIRGVNVDGVIRTLVSRGLVTEVGTESESGATLFGTTAYFLERLGAESLADLPPLSEYLPDPYALDEDDVSTST
jgi:segregation and condensation protein B